MPHAASKRALFAALRLAYPAKPKRRTPGQVPPARPADHIARDFFAALRPLLAAARAAVEEVTPEIVAELEALRARTGKTDGAAAPAPPVQYAEFLSEIRELASTAGAKVVRYGWSAAGPMLALETPGDPSVVIVCGQHGEEQASPMLIARHGAELFAAARAAGVGLRVYPCINPEGFAAGTRRDRDGNTAANAFLEYMVREEWRGELHPGQRFEAMRRPKMQAPETAAFYEDLVAWSNGRNVLAVLDLHQDAILKRGQAFAYTFGRTGDIARVLSQSAMPLRERALENGSWSDVSVATDVAGLVDGFHDGSVNDWAARVGVPFSVCLEAPLPDLGDAVEIGRRFVRGMLDLFGQLREERADVGERGPSQRVKERRRVALVIARDAAGRLLLGLRRDNGRWTLPGGHLNPGEEPRAGALRELAEETGLAPRGEIRPLFEEVAPDGTRLFVFAAEVAGDPSSAGDPDEECSEWRFVEVAGGVPAEFAGNLHGPADPKRNIVLRVFGRAGERRDADIGGGRGIAIGAGRAAQLGKSAGEQDRKRAREIGEELDRASAEGKRAAKLIDKAAAKFAAAFRPRELHAVVKRFGTATDLHQKRELDKQCRAAIGIPLSALTKPYIDKLDEWAAFQVDRIAPTRTSPFADPIMGSRTLCDRYFDRLRLDVLDAFSSATHPNTLEDQLRERYEMSERDARRLARDQIGHLQSDLNHARIKDLGVDFAIWRTARDNRVCDECFPREGVRFKLSEGIDGAIPGDCHVGDRCYSEPDFSALLDSL